MNIAVNTRFLLKDKLEGIGWFTYQTLRRIVLEHPEHQFTFIFDRPYHPDFIFAENVTPLVVGPPARHPVLWYWWFERSLPAVLKRIGASVFISTDGYGSLRARIPQLLVIHDLAFEHFDDHHSFMVRRFLRNYTPLYAQKAARLVTVSEFSKNDIATRYHVPFDKIDVVYNGVNELYKPANEATIKQVKDKYTGGNDYLVYAGSIHPRKNVARLLQAFDEFRKQHKRPIKLLLVGGKGWKTGEVFNVLGQMKHRDDVILTGHLSAKQLAPVTASAKAMMYTSLFEGFGIPIIEAMRCGVPVVTSNTSSMPEVAGDAALIVDPYNVNAIAEAMQQVLTDDDLREQLVTKGLQRAAQFNWDTSARELWASIEQILPVN